MFEREQKIFDDASAIASDIQGGASLDIKKYIMLTKEYGRILKQLRRVTKSSDRTTYDSMIAKERAVAMADARASFLANMSHEIRTPMNGVIGLTDLALDDTTLSDKQRGYLLNIKKSADGLLAIINDILDISKIDAGELTLENTPFDLHGVFSECQAVITHKAQGKNLDLIFSDETTLKHKLIGDPTRLRQALLNLLSNAIKFTKSGSVTLSAKSSELPGGRVSVLFEIIDTGIGMTDEQCEKIFEPFKQADDSTTRNFGGTGLGLSITKNIIEMMGGQISVESKPQVGSKFCFTAVFELSGEVATPENGSESPCAAPARPVFSGAALVCDDNETNQVVACENLEKLGFSVAVANHGKAAVDLLASDIALFDVIFMDMHMPVMDGLEATREILKLGVTTPIIAMTANAMEQDLERCLEAGMVDYITKPFRPSDLWSCLLRHLEPVRMSSPATENDAPLATEQHFAFEGGEHIDSVRALSYLGGNERLYAELLHKFFDEQPRAFMSLETAISGGDFPRAGMIAHTMKGVCATIGAVKLPALFEALERVFLGASPDGYSDDMLLACKLELDNVLGVIASLNPAAPIDNEPGEQLDREMALELIDEIKPLLEIYVSMNDEQIATISAVLSPIGELCDVLVSRLNDFDLEGALETLNEIESTFCRTDA